MKVVRPNEITTLFLAPTYLPFRVGTARAAFYNLLKGKGQGIDANHNPFNWDRYISGNISVHPDQPVMRSGYNPSYKDNVWAIPTVFVVNESFFKGMKYRCKKVDKGGLPPLKDVYDFYHGVCCFCHQKIKFSEASREHIHSRSLGGSNNEDNIALACKDCNSRAGNSMPKLDIHNKPIVAKLKIRPNYFKLDEKIAPRAEWAKYII